MEPSGQREARHALDRASWDMIQSELEITVLTLLAVLELESALRHLPPVAPAETSEPPRKATESSAGKEAPRDVPP